MGYTLDELLDTTGVSDLAGGNLTKKASAKAGPDMSKLAERCRRAVDVTPEEHVTSGQRELVEKTAAVAIISRTLSEIRSIEGASPEVTKLAAQSSAPDQAEFVKAALEAGHGPQEIAEFLEKSAGRVGRYLQGLKGSSGYNKAMRAGRSSAGAAKKNTAEWHDLIRKSKNASPGEQARLLSKMRREMGDAHTQKLFSTMGGGHGFKNLEGFKDLQKTVAAAPATGEAAAQGGKGYAASMNIGGSKVGITADQAKKMKKPALYAGAGMLAHKAVTGPKEPKRGGRGRGPVIITG